MPARTHAETIIATLCAENNLKKPRIYRKVARKVYLNIVRRKKKAKKWLRAQLRKLLGFLNRAVKIIQRFLSNGAILSGKHQTWWETIQKIYDQQKYMYDHRTHCVTDRIVSFHQPWIRPIVRGKAKAATEFGAKYDMSIDSGIARIEQTSFDAYNESEVLVSAIRRYYDRHGCYPKRVLADKIYRNRKNIQYCKARSIRLSGPALGRPRKNEIRDKRIEYRDNADRVEVERGFSQLKRKFGAGLITTKRQDTTLSSIVLSVIAMNLSKVTADFLRQFFKGISKIYPIVMNYIRALFIRNLVIIR